MEMQRVIPRMLFVAGAVLFIFFLWWHLRLGLVRYFDVDEFAYPHWASHLVMGKRPYIDFFLYVPPGFLWILAPLFLFGTGGIFPLIAARVLAFVIFVGISLITMLIFWEMRRSWLTVVAGAVLAFLPLPFDKYVEVRPDNLATLLFLLGLLFQLWFLRTEKKRWGFWSGLVYGVSLVVLTKGAPLVAFAFLIALFSQWSRQKYHRDAAGYFKTALGAIGPMVGGFTLPVVVGGIWAFFLGDIGLVIYSLVTLPFEVHRISRFFIMMPDLFFYPNSIVYGAPGYSVGLVVNHVLWIVGLSCGMYRLVTPFLTRGKHDVWKEILLAGTFLLSVFLYVQIIPLKHMQYLIPIGVFVAWYVADSVFLIWERVARRAAGALIFAILFILAALSLYRMSFLVNEPKLAWTNEQTLDELKNIFSTIPKTEYVLDLDGATLYYPDPYYVCCLPFGEFAPFLRRPLPSLRESLERTQTKYIYQGQLKRVKTLSPEDQDYIAGRYVPLVGNRNMLVRKP